MPIGPARVDETSHPAKAQEIGHPSFSSSADAVLNCIILSIIQTLDENEADNEASLDFAIKVRHFLKKKTTFRRR